MLCTALHSTQGNLTQSSLGLSREIDVSDTFMLKPTTLHFQCECNLTRVCSNILDVTSLR